MKPADTLLAIKALGLAPNLLPNDRRVGSAIIDHFNRSTGQCDPGLERIAGLLGISSRTVIRAVKRLVKAGLFNVIRHGGRSNRNSYEPNWSAFAKLNDAWRERFGRRRSTGTAVSPSTRQSCHLVHDNGVNQTCTSNLSKTTFRDDTINPSSAETGSKGLGKGSTFAALATIQRALTVSSTSSSVAARLAAQRRWDADLLRAFASHQRVYASIIERIDEAIAAATTDAELKQRGGGLRFLIDQLRLPDPSGGGTA